MEESVPHRITLLVPFLGGAVVFGIYRIFYIAANIYNLDVGLGAGDLCDDFGTSLGTLQPVLGQLTWSVTGMFFVVTFFSAVILLGRIILFTLHDQTAGNRYRPLVLTVVAVVSAGWLSRGDNPFAVQSFDVILARTFELLNMPYAEILLNAFSPIIFAALILLVVAAWSAITCKSATGESEEMHLRNRFRHLNTALFVGATMLVAGIVHASAVHRLPGTLLDEAGAEKWSQLVQGLSASTGAVWTLILLGTYLPSLLVLQTHARRLALVSAEAKTPQEVDEWLLKNGLTNRVSQKLTQVMALLSPLIIGGPAAPLLQLLTG